jgi:hypothetical protein
MAVKKKLYRVWGCRCGARFTVLETDPNKHLVPDRFKCWAKGCRYYVNRDDSLDRGLVAQAIMLYQVLSGLGSEDEKKCGPADVRKMMLGKKVVAVSVEPAPDKHRSFITNLTLEDGKTLHLAPSTRGVTIYKVTHG